MGLCLTTGRDLPAKGVWQGLIPKEARPPGSSFCSTFIKGLPLDVVKNCKISKGFIMTLEIEWCILWLRRLEFATEIKLRYPAAKGHDAQVFYLDIQRMCCPEPHFFFFCSLEAYPSIELGLQFPQEHQLYKLCNVYLIITLYGYRGRIMCIFYIGSNWPNSRSLEATCWWSMILWVPTLQKHIILDS